MKDGGIRASDVVFFLVCWLVVVVVNVGFDYIFEWPVDPALRFSALIAALFTLINAIRRG